MVGPISVVTDLGKAVWKLKDLNDKVNFFNNLMTVNPNILVDFREPRRPLLGYERLD